MTRAWQGWGFAVSVWLTPMAAAATPSPDTIAYPPLVVVGGAKADAKQFDGLLGEVLRELGLKAAQTDKQKAFLATQKAGRCVDNDCLDRLAHFSDAGRALLVSVAPFSRKVTLAGKAVSIGGTPPKLFETKEYAKKPNEGLRSSVKRALVQFLSAALGRQQPVVSAPAQTKPQVASKSSSVQTLPPAVVIESPSGGHTSSQVPPVPYDEEPDDGLGEPVRQAAASPVEIKQVGSGSGQSWVGRSAPFVGGLGIAGLVLGTVLQINSNASWSNYNKLYSGQSLTPSQLGEVKAAHDRAKGQQTGAAISWAVGGAAVVGGITMFLLDPPWRTPSSSSVSSEPRTGLSVSPAGIAWSGVFE